MTNVLNVVNSKRIANEDLKQALAEESLFKICLEVYLRGFEDVRFLRRESIKEKRHW